jgi:hypothetical protein
MPDWSQRTGGVGVLQADRPIRTAPPGGACHLGQPVRAQSPRITEWLSHPRRARWQLHFTPTSSSWCNLIERWFTELTDRRLRRGVFSSVTELIEAIIDWAGHWNHHPKPFVWRKTAEDVIEKVQRGPTTLSQVKLATGH